MEIAKGIIKAKPFPLPCKSSKVNSYFYRNYSIIPVYNHAEQFKQTIHPFP
jgi:hypothetical protein